MAQRPFFFLLSLRPEARRGGKLISSPQVLADQNLTSRLDRFDGWKEQAYEQKDGQNDKAGPKWRCAYPFLRPGTSLAQTYKNG